MDPFALVLIGGLVAVGFWVWLIGRQNPGSGLDALGLRSAREITETREALEAEDLEQMLAAHNARRRARGEREVTTHDLELQVAQDQADQRRRQQELASERASEQELDELLEATNARRRARGLPERTRAEALQEFGGAECDRPAGS